MPDQQPNPQQNQPAAPQGGQSSQLTPREIQHFNVLGIQNPDPNKHYTVQELEAAKTQQDGRIQSECVGARAIERNAKMQELENAFSALSQKYNNQSQQQAHDNSGAGDITQAHKAWTQKNQAIYNDTAGRLTQQNYASNFLMFLLYEIVLRRGKYLFKDFDGPQPTPKEGWEDIGFTDEQDQKAKDTLQDYADRANIRVQYENEHDPDGNPNKITNITGPAFEDCTPEQQQARQEMRDKFIEQAQDAGLIEMANQAATPTPSPGAN